MFVETWLRYQKWSKMHLESKIWCFESQKTFQRHFLSFQFWSKNAIFLPFWPKFLATDRNFCILGVQTNFWPIFKYFSIFCKFLNISDILVVFNGQKLAELSLSKKTQKISNFTISTWRRSGRKNRGRNFYTPIVRKNGRNEKNSL